jgi:hypothetical protein
MLLPDWEQLLPKPTQTRRPELLLHPNVPKPLHGVNPRAIRGKSWWDKQRQLAYSKYDYHCWACGIHKSIAKYHKWLEAHEVYTIDYATGRVELIEICALCHSCHNYIHDGRMQMLVLADQFPKDKYLDILAHGEAILKQFLSKVAKNYQGEKWKKPYENTEPFEYFFPDIYVPCLPKPAKSIAHWSKWHLVLDGEKHYSRFANYEEWQAYYLWLNENQLGDSQKALERFKQ